MKVVTISFYLFLLCFPIPILIVIMHCCWLGSLCFFFSSHFERVCELVCVFPCFLGGCIFVLHESESKTEKEENFWWKFAWTYIYTYTYTCVCLLLYRMLSKIFVLAVKCWDCQEIIPNGLVRGMVDKLQGGEGDESLYLIWKRLLACWLDVWLFGRG